MARGEPVAKTEQGKSKEVGFEEQFRQDRYNLIMKEARRIVEEVDEYATFYAGQIFRSGNKKIPYIIMRYGENELNNVIAMPFTGKYAAMFAWCGETGDDPEGWRPYFLGSIQERDKSVHRFTANGYSTRGAEALEDELGRAHYRLELDARKLKGQRPRFELVA